MAADVKSEKLFLIGKFLVFAPRFDRLSPGCCGRVRVLIKERDLSGQPVALESRRGCKRIVDQGEEFRAITSGEIKRAGPDEAFQHLAIGHARIEPAAEVLQRSKLAALLALADGHGHRCFTDVFDRCEAVTNGVVAGMVDPGTGITDAGYSFWCELQPALVNVGRQNGNPHAFAFADEHRNFFGVIDFVAQQTRHELHRVMCLEVGRMVTDHTISCAVTLIESVTGKFLEQIENGVRLFLGDFVRAGTAIDEVPAFFRHLLLVFLAHGTPEQIALRE